MKLLILLILFIPTLILELMYLIFMVFFAVSASTVKLLDSPPVVKPGGKVDRAIDVYFFTMGAIGVISFLCYIIGMTFF